MLPQVCSWLVPARRMVAGGGTHEKLVGDPRVAGAAPLCSSVGGTAVVTEIAVATEIDVSKC